MKEKVRTKEDVVVVKSGRRIKKSWKDRLKRLIIKIVFGGGLR